MRTRRGVLNVVLSEDGGNLRRRGGGGGSPGVARRRRVFAWDAQEAQNTPRISLLLPPTNGGRQTLWNAICSKMV